ncbi:MAG TPA: SDR family oxidoreductase [Bryobacteraceae bacterium]|nr:SDR family oxidoreductase [Bryobacteraceae bacterium]
MLTPASAERFALVTGGSRGIGRAICQSLARDGYTVFVNFCTNAAAAVETVAAIRAMGQHACAMQADVSDEAQVRTMFRNINAHAGRLDVLVNNAGRTLEALLTLTSPGRFLDLLKVNLLGAHMCSQAAIRIMLRHNRGCIVNVSTAAALRVPTGLGAYAASKAAMNALTKGFAREVAGRGIRVNSIAPAYVRSDMLASSRDRVASEEVAKIPLGRIAEPEEIAAAVAAIVRDDFSYLTGQIVVLDGGRGS